MVGQLQQTGLKNEDALAVGGQRRARGSGPALNPC